jgi:hypothetical protein
MEICSRCNNEFIVGARFCHICGTEREAQPKIAKSGLSRHLDLGFLRESLGLGWGSLVAFIAGLLCLGCAAGTGFLYTASTLLDWQAVQIWRIEWLLGAAASLLAGILLKRAA